MQQTTYIKSRRIFKPIKEEDEEEEKVEIKKVKKPRKKFSKNSLKKKLKIKRRKTYTYDSKIKYCIKRMLPVGKIRYFFSNLQGVLLARDVKEIEFNQLPMEIVKFDF
jgi:hypothetical protein